MPKNLQLHRQLQLLKYEPEAQRQGLDFQLMLMNQLQKYCTWFWSKKRHYMDLSKRQWEHVCYHLHAKILHTRVLRRAIQRWRMHTASANAVLRLRLEPVYVVASSVDIRAWVENGKRARQA